MHLPSDVWRVVRHALPIPCVDLVVSDGSGRVLLVERKIFPTGWWFPGGRVYVRETRSDAARRKLAEECGLEPLALDDWGTHDLIFDGEVPEEGAPHAITTLFHVRVAATVVTLDEQSAAFDWRPPARWLDEIRHPLLRAGLERAARERSP
jgi:ADP-ribose pyrophosphatase YjhB (NUDIX family)